VDECKPLPHVFHLVDVIQPAKGGQQDWRGSKILLIIGRNRHTPAVAALGRPRGRGLSELSTAIQPVAADEGVIPSGRGRAKAAVT